MKRFTMKIAALGLALCTALGAYAQTGLGQISGYFRISNAESGKYVEVYGPFSADPQLTLEQAENNAGTVIYVEAEQTAGENFYRVTSLRSQGIDVVGTSLGDDYYDGFFNTIFTEQGFDNFQEALWNIVRGGFEHGYISIGRAAIQSVILIVAQRLDSEKVDGLTAGQLADIADNFNNTVASEIDLDIRLEPVEGAENTFRIFYEIPELTAVSDWYNQKDNKEVMDLGFAAMRQYLTAKMGVTGEGFDPQEVAEMAAWGYTLPDEYREKPNADGVYQVSYEEIFANPTLLFNWLKLNVIKFTDPERCPDIELQGISLKAVSEELQNHRLTQQIISYLPRVQTEQRIYLCDGKNGNFGHFDFTSLDGANGLGKAAQWVLNGIDNKDQKFFATTPQTLNQDGSTTYYGAVYYDFPASAANSETTSLYTFSQDQYLYSGYTYVTRTEAEGTIALKTPFLVQSTENAPQLNVADGEFTITPITNNTVMNVSSEQGTGKQRARKYADATTPEQDPDPATMMGVLLSQDVSNLYNYLGVAVDKENPSYHPFYIFDKTQVALGSPRLAFSDSYTYGISNAPANTPIYWLPNENDEKNANKQESMILIDKPEIEIIIGNTETGEEEGIDDDNVPDEEKIRLAAQFDGTGANLFDGYISIPEELTIDKDFTVEISAPHADNETANNPVWMAPAVVPTTSQALIDDYKNAFLAIQPEPEDYDGSSAYVPGLYTQYLQIMGNSTSFTNDLVDGFYLDNELHMETTLEESNEETLDGLTSYKFEFDPPCSGLYQMVIASTADSEYQFTKTVNIKIYPNLYGKFGVIEENGFNISGYSASGDVQKYNDADGNQIEIPIINIPEDEDGNLPIDIENCIAYIPGTYFASSLTVAVGSETKASAAPRRVAAANDEATENTDWVYSANNLDLSSALNSEEPISVTVDKNGVSKTYQFFVQSTSGSYNTSTGVDSIGSEEGGEAVYYNLQGVKVANPDKGIFVKVVNGNASKVVL